MKNNNCVQCGPYQIGNPWKRWLHFLEWDTDWATHLGGSIQFFKLTICYDQGGVVIATKWHYYLFCVQQYISALGPVLPKSFTRAFSSNSDWCSSSLSEICKSVIEIFWDVVFMVRNTCTVKNGKSWCLAVICRKRSAFDVQFHLIVVSIFLKKVCERSCR